MTKAARDTAACWYAGGVRAATVIGLVCCVLAWMALFMGCLYPLTLVRKWDRKAIGVMGSDP